jgi:hypothetical protein
MSKLDFGFGLFQYSIVLLVVGMMIGMFLQIHDERWPKARKWWAYPVLLVGFGILITMSIIRFIIFVKTFGAH